MDENRNTVMPEAESEENLSEILQIRRDKLAALQAEGPILLHRCVLTVPATVRRS